MELQAKATPAQAARVSYTGVQTDVIATYGQSLKIETTPDGVEILNVEIPAGKEWNIMVRVEISETDV